MRRDKEEALIQAFRDHLCAAAEVFDIVAFAAEIGSLGGGWERSVNLGDLISVTARAAEAGGEETKGKQHGFERKRCSNERCHDRFCES